MKICDCVFVFVLNIKIDFEITYVQFKDSVKKYSTYKELNSYIGKCCFYFSCPGQYNFELAI